jgi:putative tricarboxylic transport membrane protein
MARNGDVFSAAALAGLGGYIIVEARHWEYIGPDGPGPGFFPLWYGIAMVALSALLIATSLRSGASGAAPNRREVGRALAAWAGLALCVALLKVLGFVLAFGLFTFFLAAVMYRRPLGRSVAIAAGMIAGFYLVFPLALNVPLPVGRLGF